MRVWALAALLLASSAAAQTGIVASSTGPLSIQDCVRIALRESPSLRSAQLRIEQARRQSRAAAAAFGPRVDFMASQALLGYDNAGQRIDSPRYDEDTHVYALTGEWALFNNLRDARAFRKSRLDTEVSRLERGRAEQELIDAAVEAYFGELLALRLGEVRRRFRDSRREYLDVTERLYKAGVRSYGDLLDAKTQVRQQELEVLRAERGERSARAALNLLLGRPVQDALVLADVSGVPERPGDLEGELRTATETRAEAQAAQRVLEKAEVDVRAAWADVFPALTLDASYRYRFDQPRYTVAPGVRVPVTNPYWQVGARLSLPVFDGGARWQQVKVAQLARDIAREEMESLRRRIASELLAAHLDLEENRAAWEMAREELATARERLRIVLEQYREGTSTALVVKDAQNTLTGFEVSEAEALYRAHTARAALLKALGTLTEGLR